MPPIPRNDPYAAYNFEVVIQDISNDGKAAKGAFSEVTGLDMEITPIDYRTGPEDIVVRKLPGLKKFPNLVFKHGIIGDPALWNWILQGANGTTNRRHGSIILHDEAHQEVMRWNFQRAWPTKYAGPQLGATKNEIALETLELAHEGCYIDVG
jgi:phage tail-like protein